MIRGLLLALALAGCAGNSAAPDVVPASEHNGVARHSAGVASGTVVFQIDVPSTTPRTMRSHFISPSTQSGAFVLYPLLGTKPVATYVNLTASTNSHCVRLRAKSTVRCRVAMHPKIGQYRAAIDTYDGPLGTNGLPTGHKLSANKYLPVYVPSYGITIALAIYLNGIPQSVRVTAPLAGDQIAGFSLYPCQRFPQIFTLTALDADGNIIIGPGSPKYSLSSTSSQLVASPVDPSAPNEFRVDAAPNATPGPGTLLAAVSADGAAKNHTSFANVNVSTTPVDPDGCLLVGNYGIDSQASNVMFFAPGATEPAMTVTDNISGPYSFAFDARKDLYVENYWGDSVTEYDQSSATPIRTFAANEPYAIALDASGNLYVANSGNNTVSVFAPDTTTASYQISVQEPEGLAIDSSGNLYVASFYAPIAGSGIVRKYAPGATTPSKAFTVGTEARQLAFDHAGNLYVMCDGSFGSSPASSIWVFAPGATTPTNTITDGVADPEKIALDSSNNLYVANYSTGTVTVYGPGQTSPSKTLSTGRPTWSVFVDSADRLYAGTSKHVFIYPAGSSTPSSTITDGIIGALGLAVTP